MLFKKIKDELIAKTSTKDLDANNKKIESSTIENRSLTIDTAV
ncbi:hypothetical protein [Bacillus thuringiensis]|nr:hypothetical protein BCAH1134_C0570 [Bacillus cereus AH1134]